MAKIPFKKKAEAAAKMIEAAGVPRTGLDLELSRVIIDYGDEEDMHERLQKTVVNLFWANGHRVYPVGSSLNVSRGIKFEPPIQRRLVQPV